MLSMLHYLKMIQTIRCYIVDDIILKFGILAFFMFPVLSYGQERCATKPTHTVAFEEWLSSKIRAKKQRRALEPGITTYEIPVVVHVIEPVDGASLNITDEKIIRQIEILNEDYRRKNRDMTDTPPIFLPVAADTEIQFVLAKRDPNGNPTNGIVRAIGTQHSYSPNATSHLSSLRLTSYWPPKHYLNIFVTRLSGFLGYSSFPETDLEGVLHDEDDSILDAVIIDEAYFGENPDASSFESLGRTATHEIGHYLGLRHPWGDGNCFLDDFVSDTPTTRINHSGVDLPCEFPRSDRPGTPFDEGNSCTFQDNPDLPDMFQNYMDYTNDVCMNLFTKGQKERMLTVLENSPRRNSLLTSPALNPVIRFENDLAISQINAPNKTECSNIIFPSIEIINYGINGVTSYTIELIINGLTTQMIYRNKFINTFKTDTVYFTPESIEETPSTVTFAITSVNDEDDGNTINNAESVTITNTSTIFSFGEDFEDTPNIEGLIGALQEWEIMTVPRHVSSNRALRFKSFENTTAFGNETVIKTPVLNFSNLLPSADLIFSHSYASTSRNFLDGLTIQVSTDCGETFPHTIFNAYGDALATSPETATAFVPKNLTDWKDDTINITSMVRGVDGVQIAFIVQNGGNNHIYLDEIKVVQVNRNAHDGSLLSIYAPLVTCSDMTSITFDLLNVGYEMITSLSYTYTLHDESFTMYKPGLSIPSGSVQTFSFDVELMNTENPFLLTLNTINNVTDQDLSNNSLPFTVKKTTSQDSYPLIVDFDRPHNWIKHPTSQTAIWEETIVGANQVLLANGFTQTNLGSQDWFISPELKMGNVDSVGLSFKASYAAKEGFLDRLQVLMSTNCGESYDYELFNIFSDSLAVTQSNSAWTPSNESDWKKFEVSLKTVPTLSDKARVAFIFTNGNGNNLYIDDINIGLRPKLSSENDHFIIFPNPAQDRFNIAFNLRERDDIQIQIIDISGRIVYNRFYRNVIDQLYDFELYSKSGYYLVKIVGNKINQTKRLYIRP